MEYCYRRYLIIGSTIGYRSNNRPFEENVFRIRHKFLLLLEDVLGDSLLSGVIESDETFVQESYKGTKIEGRKPRKRQAPASKRACLMSKYALL